MGETILNRLAFVKVYQLLHFGKASSRYCMKILRIDPRIEL
jgi:hypothetical protein